MGKKTVRGHDIANRFVYSLIHPHSGWFFLFGHSPNTTSYAQVRLFFGLPATRGVTCYP